MERNKTSYRHLEDKRKKRDASWRELQDVEESVYDGPCLAQVYANGRYVPLIGSSTFLTTARLLREEEKDRADRKVQMEKEKAEEEEQYRIWQQRRRIHLNRTARALECDLGIILRRFWLYTKFSIP